MLFVVGLWCWASFVAPTSRVVPSITFDDGGDGGFAPCEALLRRVVGVSHPCMAQFPPIGGGVAAVRGGVTPKSQTTSVKNADNGLLMAKWSAFWTQRCLSWGVVRTLTPGCARKPLDTHVNPSICTWAALPTRISSGPRATCRAHVRLVGPTCESLGPRADVRADAWLCRTVMTASIATGLELRGTGGSWARLLAALTH